MREHKVDGYLKLIEKKSLNTPHIFSFLGGRVKRLKQKQLKQKKAKQVPSTRTAWGTKTHESRVEKFYGVGAENFGEYHNGYLNFGLWEDGITDYVAAAENLVHRIGTMAGLTKESRLLDVGCGMGTQDVFLHTTFGCTIEALDVTWKHVEWTKQRAQKAGLAKHITAHHGTATKLPFPDTTFSHVTSIEGTVHFNTREDFMREAYRVLQPGGVVSIADYLVNHQPKKIMEKIKVHAARFLWRCPKANVVTPEQYKAQLENAGFRNVTIQKVGAQTIPGYYHEAQRPDNVARQRKIRGRFATMLGFWCDYSLYKAHKDGLLEYVLVRAEK